MALNMLTLLLIPCLLLVIVLSFITLNRYISYKERVALAQLGFTIEDVHRYTAARHGSRGVLWGGVITAMSGLALLLGLSTIGFGAWLLGGLLPLFVGLGMVLIYFTSAGPAPGPQHCDEPGADGDNPGGNADRGATRTMDNLGPAAHPGSGPGPLASPSEEAGSTPVDER